MTFNNKPKWILIWNVSTHIIIFNYKSMWILTCPPILWILIINWCEFSSHVHHIMTFTPILKIKDHFLPWGLMVYMLIALCSYRPTGTWWVIWSILWKPAFISLHQLEVGSTHQARSISLKISDSELPSHDQQARMH